MNKRTTHLLILILIGLSTQGYASLLSDTLIICQGESIQLNTLSNQISYDWAPREAISNPAIANPVVSPMSSTTYKVEIEARQENLVFNGDFSDGNVGFTSDYEYTAVSSFQQGKYGVFTSPTQFNMYFGDCDDHSSSSDELMLIADGATTRDENIWCQTIEVYPNQLYNFSAWITNIHESEPSVLQFSINGDLLGDEFAVDPELCEWQNFAASWNSIANTEATICLTNQSTVSFGNDFALDDISFILERRLLRDTIRVIVQENRFTNIDTSICANTSLSKDGVLIPANSQMAFNFTAINGCDSIVQVNVGSINTFYSEMRIDTLCLGDTISYEGLQITNDTTICEVYTNVLGCDSTFCFVSYFFSDTTITFDVAEPNCYGESNGQILARPFAGLPPYQYQWGIGSTNSEISNLSAGLYELTITDADACVVRTSVQLLEPSPLEVAFDITEPSCHGFADGQILLDVNGGRPTEGLYELTLGNLPTISDTIFSDMLAGNYRLSIVDGQECLLDTTVVLTEPNPILIVLPRDTALQLGCFLDIDAEITADYSYEVQWTPTVSLDCSICESVRATPTNDANFSLSVLDEQGCIQIEKVGVSVIKDYEVYIPNAFSPDGDGINDFHEIFVGKDVEEILSFRIYNRWGEAVFVASNYLENTADTRWDGFYKGNPLAPAVFTYVSVVRFIDGEERVFSGGVSLVR